MGIRQKANPPARRDDIVVEELDGEAVVYDPASGAVHRLNGVACSVWHLCDGSRTPVEITDAFRNSHACDGDEASVQVEAVLSEFREKGLLFDDFVDETGAENDALERAGEGDFLAEPATASRRELLAGGFGKAVLVAPAVSTFFALNTFAAGSNPINPGFSATGPGGCKNPGFSCTTNSDCCGSGLENAKCQGGACCVQHLKNGCQTDSDCCDVGDTCSGGKCN